MGQERGFAAWKRLQRARECARLGLDWEGVNDRGPEILYGATPLLWGDHEIVWRGPGQAGKQCMVVPLGELSSLNTEA